MDLNRRDRGRVRPAQTVTRSNPTLPSANNIKYIGLDSIARITITDNRPEAADINNYEVDISDSITGITSTWSAVKSGAITTIDILNLVNNRQYNILLRAIGVDMSKQPAVSAGTNITPRLLKGPSRTVDPDSETGKITLYWAAPASIDIPDGFNLNSYEIICTVKDANGITSPAIPAPISNITGLSSVVTGLTNHVLYTFTIYCYYTYNQTGDTPYRSIPLVIDWSPLPVPVLSSNSVESYTTDGYQNTSLVFTTQAGIVGYAVNYNNMNYGGSNSGNTVRCNWGISNNTPYTVNVRSWNKYNASKVVPITFTSGREPQVTFSNVEINSSVIRCGGTNLLAQFTFRFITIPNITSSNGTMNGYVLNHVFNCARYIKWDTTTVSDNITFTPTYNINTSRFIAGNCTGAHYNNTPVYNLTINTYQYTAGGVTYTSNINKKYMFNVPSG